jgi:quinol-cytochrome oxidoreductase complex cytochrome b subunit
MMTPFNSITQSRVWRSIFRHGWPDTPLNRSLVMTNNFFLHIHPVKVNLKSLRATYSFGLGVITLIAFLSLGLTGVILMFYYVPSTEQAYSNIVTLQTAVPFGQFLRNLHRWGAHLMVFTTILHMARVFYTGAYKPPREFNWVIGVILLVLTLGASFSGYLLPWDQLSYWAITVGTSIASYTPVFGMAIQNFLLGGPEVGQAALTRFYALHIIVIPAALALLISIHLWRVRKDGGLAAHDKNGKNL